MAKVPLSPVTFGEGERGTQGLPERSEGNFTPSPEAITSLVYRGKGVRASPITFGEGEGVIAYGERDDLIFDFL